MALFYSITVSSSRVHHVSWEKMLQLDGVPSRSGGIGDRGRGWSGSPKPEAQPAWRRKDEVGTDFTSAKGTKNLPTGMGRDKTVHSLRAIPHTWASSTIFLPARIPFPRGMKNDSITWLQANISSSTAVTTIK